MLKIKLHIFRSPFYRTFTRPIGVYQIKIPRYTSRPWNFIVYSELWKFIRLKIVLTFYSWTLVVVIRATIGCNQSERKKDNRGIVF